MAPIDNLDQQGLCLPQLPRLLNSEAPSPVARMGRDGPMAAMSEWR